MVGGGRGGGVCHGTPSDQATLTLKGDILRHTDHTEHPPNLGCFLCGEGGGSINKNNNSLLREAKSWSRFVSMHCKSRFKGLF